MGERIYGKRVWGSLKLCGYRWKSRSDCMNNLSSAYKVGEETPSVESSRAVDCFAIRTFVWYGVLSWRQLGLFEASLDSSEYSTGSILLLKGSFCKGIKFEWNCFGSVLCTLVWTLSSFNTYMEESSQCLAALDVDAHKSLAQVWGVSNLSTTPFP
ncbi:hypothetical protein REPUB_Repub12eG0095000 [Reevesia pubescens]